MMRKATDHPRIRGEHGQWLAPGYQAIGSSPHTRGALRGAGQLIIQGRIIPAYAGSTPRRYATGRNARDHPRIRGEHFPRGEGAGVDGGSSPHTRGARLLIGLLIFSFRIIPAYAGSTGRRPAYGRWRWDHPRIRGEHLAVHMATSKAAGSSPHTRGARPRRTASAFRHRIIPAYAGSTNFSPPRSSMTRDHPRIRGEHTFAAQRPRSSAGSSPHTRGAHHHHKNLPRPWRIIPAYAGSTIPKIHSR